MESQAANLGILKLFGAQEVVRIFFEYFQVFLSKLETETLKCPALTSSHCRIYFLVNVTEAVFLPFSKKSVWNIFKSFAFSHEDTKPLRA